MKKIIFAAILIIPLLILGVKGFSGAKKQITLPVELPTKPWITIDKPEAALLTPDGKVLRTLASGDSLDIPSTIAVGPDGQAKVHFLDGSVLRLDSGTRIDLNEGSYDKRTGTLVVKVALAVGKVWSKVIELATPASTWEVRTSNAVATVRGTAFGMGTDGKKSRMFGSEHRVAVQVVDPKTGKGIGKEAVILDEGKLLEWSDDDVENIRNNKKIILAVDIKTAVAASAKAGSSDDKDRQWIGANESEDSKIQIHVNELKEQGAGRQKLQEELIKESLKQIKREVKKEEVVETKIEEQNKKEDVVEKKEPVELPIRKIEKKVEDIEKRVEKLLPIVERKKGEPKEIVISPDPSSANLIEQRPVSFKATLIYSDGQKEDVTNIVTWKVVGPIGSISRTGAFAGKLAPEVSELGEASGAVMAVWNVDGKELVARTPIFKVELKIEDDGERRG